MPSDNRVLVFVSDKVLMKALADDLRRAGYLVDRCENLETCQQVNSFYDHDAAFLQADGDDLETILAAISYVTPGARIVVVLKNPDPEISEQLEIHGIQVAAHPQDSSTLLELLQEEPGE